MTVANATMELISAEHLSDLLAANGMSRRALATAIGVAPSTAIRFAAGTVTRTTPETAQKIEQVLNVEHGTLFRVRQPITVCRLCGNQYSPENGAARLAADVEADPLLELQRASENLSKSVALALAERKRAEGDR